jgi:hypothetical protein
VFVFKAKEYYHTVSIFACKENRYLWFLVEIVLSNQYHGWYRRYQVDHDRNLTMEGCVLLSELIAADVLK